MLVVGDNVVNSVWHVFGFFKFEYCVINLPEKKGVWIRPVVVKSEWICWRFLRFGIDDERVFVRVSCSFGCSIVGK